MSLIKFKRNACIGRLLVNALQFHEEVGELAVRESGDPTVNETAESEFELDFLDGFIFLCS